MIRLKHIDFYGQIIAFAVCIILALTVSYGYFIGVYFVIGAWQIISTIIHRSMYNQVLRSVNRDSYEKVLVMVLAAGLISFLIGAIVIYGAFLLFLGAAMAFWYGAITYKEMRVWEARAFVHLK